MRELGCEELRICVITEWGQSWPTSVLNLSDLQVHLLHLYVIAVPFTVSGRFNKKQIHNTDNKGLWASGDLLEQIIIIKPQGCILATIIRL